MKASAPGKLFLMGEYAVLEGSTATLVPTPARASVSLSACAGDGNVVMRSDSEKIQPTATAVLSEPLLGAVITTLSCGDQLEGHSLVMDTSEFYRDGVKMGLGSSAALTTALVRMFSGGSDSDSDKLFSLASEAHHRFQGGHGSGADIALAAMDTAICYRINARPSPVVLPADLHMLALWTGQPASTPDYLVQMGAWKKDNLAGYQVQVQAMGEIAEAFAASLGANNTAELIDQVTRYDRALETLSAISGTGFYNQPHLELRKNVELAHCAYKPSGAGGGDFGIAFSASRKDINSLAEMARDEGRYALLLQHRSQ